MLQKRMVESNASREGKSRAEISVAQGACCC